MPSLAQVQQFLTDIVVPEEPPPVSLPYGDGAGVKEMLDEVKNNVTDFGQVLGYGAMRLGIFGPENQHPDAPQFHGSAFKTDKPNTEAAKPATPLDVQGPADDPGKGGVCKPGQFLTHIEVTTHDKPYHLVAAAVGAAVGYAALGPRIERSVLKNVGIVREYAGAYSEGAYALKQVARGGGALIGMIVTSAVAMGISEWTAHDRINPNCPETDPWKID